MIATMIVRLAIAATALGFVVLPTTVRADDATQLAQAGKALADAGDYTGALVKFRQALEIEDTPSLRCNVGAAYYKLADWMRAHAFLTDCLSVRQEPGYAAGLGAARKFCATRLRAEAGHALVEISTTPAATMSLSLFANEFSVPRNIWLPLGVQSITIKRDGYRAIVRDVVVVGRGAKLEAELEKKLEKDPRAAQASPTGERPKESRPATADPIDTRVTPTSASAETDQRSRTPAVVALSVGGVALAGAMLFHVRAVGVREDLTALPAGDQRQARIDDLKRDRTVMFALYGTAAVAAGVGVALLLRSRQTKRVSVALSPTSVGLWARF